MSPIKLYLTKKWEDIYLGQLICIEVHDAAIDFLKLYLTN